MGLYTVILEYAGGTYIGQVHAADVGGAVRSWAEGVATGSIRELPPGVGPALAGELAGDEPTPLAGLRGVWCCTASVHGRLGLVNLVHSADE